MDFEFDIFRVEADAFTSFMTFMGLREPRMVASSLPWKRALRKAPAPVFILFSPARHFCCAWFLRAQSLSNKLPGARLAAAPSRMHLYPSQTRRIRLSKHPLPRGQPASQAPCWT